MLRRLARDDRAATAVEYGLILALIVLSMFAALHEMAGTTVGMWNNVSTKVQNAR
ncbi:Flp family type IVb pilin [Sphingomonas jinjuensis]|nr:Flp family type IVb pilin [Sphingomonas jinjuensis]